MTVRAGLKLSITGLVIGVIAWQLGNVAEIARVLGRMTLLPVLATVAVITLDRALMTFKWSQLLRTSGLHLPFLTGMKIYCAAMIWGVVMPMTVGADAVRAYFASRSGLGGTPVIASILVERVIGALASLVAGLLGFVLLSRIAVLDARLEGISWLGMIALAVGALVLALSFSRRVFEIVDTRLLGRLQATRAVRLMRDLQAHLHAYRQHGRVLMTFFGLSILEQLLTILYVWLIAIGLGIDVGLTYVAGAVPLALLVARLPISVHGLGVFDGIFAAVISLGGVPLAEAIAITIAVRVLEIAAWVPWWVAHFAEHGRSTAPAAVRTGAAIGHEGHV